MSWYISNSDGFTKCDILKGCFSVMEAIIKLGLVLLCVKLWYWMIQLYPSGYFTVKGVIIWFTWCRWSNPQKNMDISILLIFCDWYYKCIKTRQYKTVCIYHGVLCILHWHPDSMDTRRTLILINWNSCIKPNWLHKTPLFDPMVCLSSTGVNIES